MEAPACDEVYVPGQPTDEVVTAHDSEEMLGGCLGSDGAIEYVILGEWECADGSRVHVSDAHGWGRDDHVWQEPGVPPPDTC